MSAAIYSWTSTLLAVDLTPTTTAGFSKGLPALPRNLLGGRFIFEDPLHGEVATELIIKPCPLAAEISCTFSPTSFSSVQANYPALTPWPIGNHL